jgi:hypothetical protein
MPCDHGRWFHDAQNIRPSRPHTPQHDPKEPIEATQHPSPTFPLQHSDLLAQGEHLQRCVQATAKENRDCGENCANHIDHKSAVTRYNDPISHPAFAFNLLAHAFRIHHHAMRSTAGSSFVRTRPSPSPAMK